MSLKKNDNPKAFSRVFQADHKQAWMDEQSLWQDFKQGNKQAYAQIYKVYSPELYHYGRHLGGEHELVRDCIQELFMHVWSKRNTLSHVNSIKSYLLKSFRRRLLRKIAAHRKHFTHLIIEDFHLMPAASSEEEMIDDQLQMEQQEKLMAALNQLTKRQREAIYLKFYHNLSYQEIAASMSLHIHTVYNMIFRAIQKLRTILSALCLLIWLFFSF